MTGDAGPAISRYDFTRGDLKGSHFTLYSSVLLHRSDRHLETLPLAAIASLRVAYERDARKIGWGISLVLIALVLFAISAPLADLSGGAAAEMAADIRRHLRHEPILAGPVRRIDQLRKFARRNRALVAGLAISVAPYLVPNSITIWDAAAAPASQIFMLLGTLPLLPIILAYTGFVYYLFRGKVREGEGYH